MKKGEDIPYKYESLSDLHRMLKLPKPMHPLISLIKIENADNKIKINEGSRNKDAISKLPNLHILKFFKISYKSNLQGRLRYGQHYYDFSEGGMFFTSPNQLMALEDDNGDYSGYTLLIHPDFFLTYPLAKKIKKFGFFSYDVSEALHLSDNERSVIVSVFKIIEEELNSRIDDFSQDVMIAQIELLLNYSNRFYKRQFITRKAVNSDLLQKLEKILADYFDDETALMSGLPTVHFLSEQLKISPRYLSDMLRALTGQSAQQHIHNKVIAKAKVRLSNSELSISEIAYELGFEHSQSFSKLFKSKTNISPSKFRKSFN